MAGAETMIWLTELASYEQMQELLRVSFGRTSPNTTSGLDVSKLSNLRILYNVCTAKFN